MATLSVVKFEFLKVAKWAAVVIGIFLVIYFIIQIFSFFANSSKRNQPTVSFGKLTMIDFPKGLDNNFTYSIDTITGAFPALPSKISVYKMIKGEPDLLAVERTGEKAKNLGFINGPIQISDVLFRWSSAPPFSRSITVNVLNPEFSITSNFIEDKFVLSASSLPAPDEAVVSARNLLEGLEFLPDNLDDGATKIKLLKIQNGTIAEASSLSNAQLISIYFFQKKNDIPFVYPGGDLSTMNLTIGSGDRTSFIVDARFFYQKVSDKEATYPLISAREAYDKLKNGKGYIATYNGSDENIYIKKAYLAYYVEGKEQDYLQPVIVFEGNNNFFAYVSAVKDEWVNN